MLMSSEKFQSYPDSSGCDERTNMMARSFLYVALVADEANQVLRVFHPIPKSLYSGRKPAYLEYLGILLCLVMTSLHR